MRTSATTSVSVSVSAVAVAAVAVLGAQHAGAAPSSVLASAGVAR